MLNNEYSIKKILLSIIYFIMSFIAYYFVIGMSSIMLIYGISGNYGDGSDNGLWAYGLILGMILAPILAIITTTKIINKK